MVFDGLVAKNFLKGLLFCKFTEKEGLDKISEEPLGDKPGVRARRVRSHAFHKK